MPVDGLHHVGIAVDDLERAVETYRRLFGAEVEHRETVADQGADVALLRVGDGRIELLAAHGPDTPVGQFSLYANETLNRLEHTPKLTIAALNGHTVGGGLEMALACDVRLAKQGAGMHHLAFEVADVGVELARLAAAGTELVDERPRRGLLGREVAFLHPHATGGVLAELVGRGRP